MRLGGVFLACKLNWLPVLACGVLGCLSRVEGQVMVDQNAPTVRIQPVGDVPGEVLNNLAGNLVASLGIHCVTSSVVPIPEGSLDPVRKQYLATKVMTVAEPQSSTEILLLVIDKDLFVPQLNFVFGVGDPRSRVAIISLVRLRQETYGLPPDRDLYERRTLTEAVHELGHVLGLGHCSNRRCVMTFSNSLADTDRKGPNFCPQCRQAFQQSLVRFGRSSRE